MRQQCAAVVWACLMATASAQTMVDLRTQSKSVDFSSANTTKPFKSGTILPAACSVGEAFFQTNAPAGLNLYGCTAVNAWTLLSAGILRGDVTGAPGASVVGQIQGRPVSTAAPSSGQSLTWNSTTGSWTPQAITGVQGPTGLQGPTGPQGPAGANGAIARIQSSGANLPVEPTLNFTGGGCTDNSANSRTDCTSSGGSVNVNGSSAGNPNLNASSPTPDSGYAANVFKVSGSNVIAETQCGSGLSVNGNGCALNTTSASGTPNFTMVQKNLLWCNSTTGTTAYNCTLSGNGPALQAIQTGVVFLLTVNQSSSTTATLQIDSLPLAPASVKLSDGVTNPGPGITAGAPYWAYYDGTVFRILGVSPAAARKVCDMSVGDQSDGAITNAQLGPQKRMCFIPAAATIVEVDVSADGGTPNVIVGVNHAGTVSSIVSSALATAASGGIACANAGGTTGIDGVSTCSATLQNASVAAGDYLGLVSGTAGGTAKLMTVHIVYTVF